MDTESRRGADEEKQECGCTWLAKGSHLGPQRSKGDLRDSGMSLYSKASLAFRHCPLEPVSSSPMALTVGFTWVENKTVIPHKPASPSPCRVLKGPLVRGVAGVGDANP